MSIIAGPPVELTTIIAGPPTPIPGGDPGHPAPTAPVDLAEGPVIATDASVGTHFRCALTGDRTLGVPTNPTDGQRALWELTASAAQRTITLATGAGGFELTAGLSTGTAIPSGRTAFLAAIYNTRRSRWTALALRVTT